MFHNRFTASSVVIIVSAFAAAAAARAEDTQVAHVASSNANGFTPAVATTQAATTLSTAVILGSTAYSPADLFPTYSAQLGRPITRTSAQSIVTALSSLYDRDGYSQPEVQVDDRFASRGILRVHVQEPRITQVTVGGNPGPYREQLESIAAPLRNSQPVRRTQVQKALQSMRELPGLTVTAATRRDDSLRNAYVLAVDTKYQPLDGRVSVTNRGTREVGRNFLMGQLSANGVLGYDEKLGAVVAGAQDPSEYHGVGLFADAPLGASGTRGFLMGFRAGS